MKLLKYFILLLLITIIGGSVFFATKDGSYDIQDSKIIDAPAEVVFNIVNNYKTWEHWGPWKKEDSTMQFIYPSNTIGEGASYSWDGDMAGSMTTTRVEKNKSIAQNLTLFTPAGERNPNVYWTFEEAAEGTKVTWGMKGEHTLVDKAFYTLSGMDFDTQMHTMNEIGLVGLEKMALEAINKYTIEVQGITQYGGGFYLYTTAATSLTQIDKTTERLMNKMMEYADQNSIAIAGFPFCIYNEIDAVGGSAIISAALPVREQIITESSDVLSGFMPAVATVKTTLKGNYTHLPEAYAKGQLYLAEKGYTPHPTANMFEVYTTDPENVPNPANWITEIYLPILIAEN